MNTLTIRERTATSGCVDEAPRDRAPPPAAIYFKSNCVLYNSEKKTCFMLLSSTILPPSLPSPLWHLSAPCLACPAIAPLLCGLSFVSPAGYSFVPPSSAPFWSGTGIASLSERLSKHPSLCLSLFHVEGCFSMLAAAPCIHIMACTSALTSLFPLHHFTS